MPHKPLTPIAAALLAFYAVSAAVAEETGRGDIRNLAVGMHLEELPATGYANFGCGSPPDRDLKGWADFRRCEPDSLGRYQVRFEYGKGDPVLARINERWEGTKVSGHPVLLSAFLGEDGTVETIRIETDPDARLYLKKKAFLLGLRVRDQYGAEGWICIEQPKASGETEVGGMFIKRRCEKLTDDRRLVLETNLYRMPSQTGREFVSSTRFEASRSGS